MSPTEPTPWQRNLDALVAPLREIRCRLQELRRGEDVADVVSLIADLWTLWDSLFDDDVPWPVRMVFTAAAQDRPLFAALAEDQPAHRLPQANC